jgi:transcriptional regulator with XRE-family HTH domain
MSFYKNFQRACSANNISVTRVLRNLGLSSSNATYWKNGNDPNTATVRKIADYLNVPITQLVDECEGTPTGISAEVLNLAKRIDKLPDEYKQIMFDNLRQFESIIKNN